MIQNKVVSAKAKVESYRHQGDRFISPESAAHLERSMIGLRSGKPRTPEFPLYGGGADEVLAQWLERLETLNVPDWMIEYEDSRTTKFGPQGELAPWDDLRENFSLYWERNSNVNPSHMMNYIVDQLKRDYGKFKLVPASLATVLDHQKSKGTDIDKAAGWPTFHLKKDDPEAKRVALKLAQSGDYVTKGVGYVATRNQKQKDRVFMPMPYAQMIAQGRFYLPWIKAIQSQMKAMTLNRVTPRLDDIAWLYDSKLGFDNVEYHMNAVIGEPKNLLYVQLDFNKMDTSTGENQYANLYVPVVQAMYSESYATEISDALMSTVRMPLVTPDGLYSGPHGTASGAEVTNDGECKVNDAFQRNALIRLANEAKRNHINYELLYRAIDGDDGAWVFRIKDLASSQQFEELIRDACELAAKDCGLVLNKDKMHISAEFGLYLQRMIYWDAERKRYVGAYPTVLALNSIMNPEKYLPQKKYDPDYWELSIIEKLENCKHHPAFTQFIDFVLEGLKNDVFRVHDIGRFKQILSKWENYNLARRNESASYVGTTSEGGPSDNILDFESVKYILKKYF